MKVVTVRDFRDRASEMFRSADVILVTRDGAPAGFYLPWNNPEVPVEVRREVFLRLSEQVGAQLVEQGASEQEVLEDFLPAAVVADANVVLSALIGGRARLVIASPHPPRCVAAEAVALEIARHIPRLASKRRLDPALLVAALQVMPIDWRAAADYDARRQDAEQRIAARVPDDWPPSRSHSPSTCPSGHKPKTSPSPASTSTPLGTSSTHSATPATSNRQGPAGGPAALVRAATRERVGETDLFEVRRTEPRPRIGSRAQCWQ